MAPNHRRVTQARIAGGAASAAERLHSSNAISSTCDTGFADLLGAGTKTRLLRALPVAVLAAEIAF